MVYCSYVLWWVSFAGGGHVVVDGPFFVAELAFGLLFVLGPHASHGGGLNGCQLCKKYYAYFPVCSRRARV